MALKPLVTQHNGRILTFWADMAVCESVKDEAKRRNLTTSAFLSRLVSAGMASLKKAQGAGA